MNGHILTEYPTNPLTFLEPRDQEIGEFYVAQEHRATDIEAPKLWKGSSGTSQFYKLKIRGLTVLDYILTFAVLRILSLYN